MASDKNVIALAMLAKVEASYNVSASLSAATDGVLFIGHPEFTFQYVYDGAVDTSPGTAGQFGRNAPSGRNATGKVKMYGKGLGSAYSSVALPPMNPWLLASGLSGSFGASAVTYAPYPLVATPVSGSSLTIGAYRRNELWTMTGAYANLTFGTSNAAAPVFEFDVSAIAPIIPTDAAPPAVTYVSASVAAPKAEGVAFAVGSWTTARVRSFKFELGRQLSPRQDLATSVGHAGFAPGYRAPKFSIVVESCPLAVFDPYTARSAATKLATSLVIGSVATNKYTLSMPNAVITDVNLQEDGPVATWEIVMQPQASAPNLGDDFSLVFA